MAIKKINIIAFNIPYPPNYGGVIDVFFKLKSLHDLGVEIYLHCFLYNRERSEELEKYCKKIFYYPRKKALFSAFGYKPYIVESRKVKALLKNLENNQYPIFFEGLHSCAFLSHPSLRNRYKMVRPCNIEHLYYTGLRNDENNPFKKLYFGIESLRLKVYEKQLKYAQKILPISETDFAYFKNKFPSIDCIYLPAFHPVSEVICKKGESDYILFHGDLSVSSNIEAAMYIAENIAKESPYRFIIAGRNPNAKLRNLTAKSKNIELIESPDTNSMHQLIENAHIHLLLSFNLSGLKLKLLQSLFQGRFILCNSILVEGSGVEKYCEIAHTSIEFKEKIKELMSLNFDENKLAERKKLFIEKFSNLENAAKITTLL